MKRLFRAYCVARVLLRLNPYRALVWAWRETRGT